MVVSGDESGGLGEGARLAGYFTAESERTGETSVSTWLAVRDDLCDASGRLRIGPILYSVDVATGLAMGVAVLEDERRVVTTDVDARLVTPVATGPLRVDAEVLRAGATTAVSAFTLHDEGTGQLVGGGTCTGRPFPFTFNRAVLDVPIGVRRLHAPTGPVDADSMPQYLGFRVVEGGAAEVDIAGWLRNPWGILHGGVTACLVDVSAEAAGAAALGRAVTGSKFEPFRARLTRRNDQDQTAQLRHQGRREAGRGQARKPPKRGPGNVLGGLPAPGLGTDPRCRIRLRRRRSR